MHITRLGATGFLFGLVGGRGCGGTIVLTAKSAPGAGVASVHVNVTGAVDGTVSFTYGPCGSRAHTDAHHVIGSSPPTKAQRLVWIIPEGAESGGCISAWGESGALLGRSAPQTIGVGDEPRRRVKRGGHDGIPMNRSSGVDVLGPWFDGVELLRAKNLSVVHVDAAKSAKVAVIGAGMSGLMTLLVLRQAGLGNVTLIEGSHRLGGRVHTEYLSGGPFDYSYQEMGAMRIPRTTSVANVTYDF